MTYRRQASWASVNSESPYPGSSPLLQARVYFLYHHYSLHPDPAKWGVSLDLNDQDPDDDLHRAEKLNHSVEFGGAPWSMRGASNLGCLILIIAGILALFIGYPVLSFRQSELATNSALGNLGGRNGVHRGLIDAETPDSAYTMPSWAGGEEMQLVFSDEFNVDGRSFYPDWEAVDLHYWVRVSPKLFKPAAITTADGKLRITLSQQETHNLSYQEVSAGMLSTWNKFCFTGVTPFRPSVRLPGLNNVQGLWPALISLWYGATLDGLWPYSYDSCDVGTAPNQTHDGLPLAATVNGDTGHNGDLSWLPGQRLSACTCPGEDERHPGPKRGNGFVGRAAPEIDVFEAQISSLNKVLVPQVSQSAQWAPFDAGYQWQNTSEFFTLADPTISMINGFKGSITQEATSILTNTNPLCYEDNGDCFESYGFEYKPGFDDAYITWIASGKVAWTIRAGGVGANTLTEIGPRQVPVEPMYIIANLGMSHNFGNVDLAHIPFPCHLEIDYIRVYQPKSAINFGCDPPDFPTQTFINTYIDAYTDPNLTTWTNDFGQPYPKSSYLGECS
ncbi:beta-glucan synthesis-associated [Mycena amicta]|nr:beta-glucan synthesis-associated [Mycena amicta]